MSKKALYHIKNRLHWWLFACYFLKCLFFFVCLFFPSPSVSAFWTRSFFCRRDSVKPKVVWCAAMWCLINCHNFNIDLQENKELTGGDWRYLDHPTEPESVGLLVTEIIRVAQKNKQVLWSKTSSNIKKKQLMTRISVIKHRFGVLSFLFKFPTRVQIF